MLAVGSSMKGNENSGYVVVYSRDGSRWELLQTITETGRTHGFGSALALSSDGKVLSIGANERNTSRSGYVQIYDWDADASKFKQVSTLTGDTGGGGFGHSVSISAGSVAVGAPYHNGDSGQLKSTIVVRNHCL